MKTDQKKLRKLGRQRCTACRKIKPLGKFYKNSSNLGGRQTECIFCARQRRLARRKQHRIYCRAWEKRNRDRRNRARRLWRRKYAREVNALRRAYRAAKAQETH